MVFVLNNYKTKRLELINFKPGTPGLVGNFDEERDVSKALNSYLNIQWRF